MLNKKSICCDADMAYGCQCLVCGADGRVNYDTDYKIDIHRPLKNWEKEELK